MNDRKNIQHVEIFGFGDLFKESSTQYEVPFFQRGYVWTKRDWDDLFNDIEEEILSDNFEDIEIEAVNEQKHFFGSIVLKRSDIRPNKNRNLIIDGQQRLVTCYAILLCIYKKLVAIERDLEINEEESQHLKSKYIVNDTDKENNYNELKVKCSQGNTLSLYKYLYSNNNPKLPEGMLEREIYLNTGSLGALFKYCEKKIERRYSTLNKLLRLRSAILNSLQFVCIYLGDEIREQVIFETLNAKGVELSPGELLCNYIFGEIRNSNSCPKDRTLDELHHEKWLVPQRMLEEKRSEKKLTREEYSSFEAFLRYSISIGHKKMLPRGRAVYYRFKEWNKGESLIEQLNIFACDMNHFISYVDPSESKEFGTYLRKFQDIGIHSVIPFVISVLREHSDNVISTEDGKKIMKTTLTLLVRNKLSGQNIKYDTFFPNLWNIISKESNDYNKALIEVIDEKGWKRRNDAFTEHLISNSIYRDKEKKFCRYLLQSIDRELSNYNQNVQYSNFYQIEHILPQNIKSESAKKWKEHLGSDIDNPDYDALIHSIGNLTLLGDGNSAVSNWFIEDKFKHKAYADPLPPITKIAKDIYTKKQEWKLNSIKERSRKLAEHACRIWSWDN